METAERLGAGGRMGASDQVGPGSLVWAINELDNA